MLLRVLDTKSFTRLGGNENLTVDFQVIAATNRNIGGAVLKTEFRADLYYCSEKTLKFFMIFSLPR